MDGVSLISFGEGRQMPRFYFDFEVGGQTLFDDQGLELKDIEIARRAAVRVIPDLIRQEWLDISLQGVLLKIRGDEGEVISFELILNT
jgi:hypothetical protein